MAQQRGKAQRVAARQDTEHPNRRRGDIPKAAAAAALEAHKTANVQTPAVRAGSQDRQRQRGAGQSRDPKTGGKPPDAEWRSTT